MKHSPARRSLLLAAASLPFYNACTFSMGKGAVAGKAQDRLAELETSVGGRLGIAALNTADGTWIKHRPDERFPFCSTFKVLVAGAILKRSAAESSLLQRQILYSKNDLVTYSPITEKHVGPGMTVADLCAAALQYSDNTAANLLMKILGGPEAVTLFARSVGDRQFRLDRWETDLNSAIPGDDRDTVTPAGMARSLQRLALGNALDEAERTQLVAWMRGNTTGAARIRAGVPAEWQVADKTGSGNYGTTNDVGVVYRSGKAALVIAIYYTQQDKDAPMRNEVIEKAAALVAEAWA